MQKDADGSQTFSTKFPVLHLEFLTQLCSTCATLLLWSLYSGSFILFRETLKVGYIQEGHQTRGGHYEGAKCRGPDFQGRAEVNLLVQPGEEQVRGDPIASSWGLAAGEVQVDIRKRLFTECGGAL